MRVEDGRRDGAADAGIGTASGVADPTGCRTFGVHDKFPSLDGIRGGGDSGWALNSGVAVGRDGLASGFQSSGGII